jgi:predicted permease
MAVMVILAAVCVAGVGFLLVFLVALCRDRPRVQTVTITRLGRKNPPVLSFRASGERKTRGTGVA